MDGAIDREARSAAVIDRVTAIDSPDFYRRYFKHKRPVLIAGLAKSWPATRRWSFEYFAALSCTSQVQVESGNVLQGRTDFQTVDFRAYMASLDKAAAPRTSPGEKDRVYLSLFNIFSSFPALRKDVDFSILNDHTLWNRTFAWLGPAGTITGYHIDWIDNLLVQIQGRKRLWLVPPRDRRAMYPSRKYDYRSTLSSVDPDHYDRRKHPLFERLRPTQLLLEPGDALYIPRGFWHRVEALEPSISINNFGHDLSGLLFFQTRALALDVLHRIGLFGQECTCHKVEQGRRLAR